MRRRLLLAAGVLAAVVLNVWLWGGLVPRLGARPAPRSGPATLRPAPEGMVLTYLRIGDGPPPPREPTRADETFAREFADAVARYIRRGDLASASQLVDIHIQQRSRGCSWGARGGRYSPEDLASRRYVETELGRWLNDLEPQPNLVEVRDVWTPPVIEHTWDRRSKQVEHSITPLRVRFAIVAYCPVTFQGGR